MDEQPLTQAELDAYYEHQRRRFPLGGCDNALNQAILDGKTVAQHVRETLAASKDQEDG